MGAHRRRLVIEQPALGGRAAAESAEAAVTAHHAVTGDQEGNGVVPERRPHRPYGAVLSDLGRDPAVGADLTRWDAAGRGEHVSMAVRVVH